MEFNRLNPENEDPYTGSAIIRGHQVDFYVDDYGQCIYFEFLDKNGQLDELSCGTYNFNYFEDAISYFDPKGYYASMNELDLWYEFQENRTSRGLESLDYDDYEVYDIEGFYKALEEKQ